MSGALPADVATWFTDHYWSEATLTALGRVVRHINAQHRSPKIRALAFLRYVSIAQPDEFEFRPGWLADARVTRFLRTAKLPPVEWVASDLRRRRDGEAS